MDDGAHHILDLRQMILPLALLKVTEAFRRIKQGEILELLAEDQEIRDDLFKVLPASRYQLIGINEGESLYRIIIRKNAIH